jgi:septal ring factor EnvC (AmiA/AmiB activator)
MPRLAAALLTLTAFSLPATVGAGDPPAAPASVAACACQDAAERAALRDALVELTRELAAVRGKLGGPFDGLEGLRREAGELGDETGRLKEEVKSLSREVDDLRRAVEAARR